MQKSIWSAVSEVVKYNSIRPEHPAAIVDNVIKFLKHKYKGPLTSAIDVGCGTGMSTRNLFGKFDNVLGVDLSEAMIEEAKECWKKENVQFKVSGAEKLPVKDSSVQLISVGRAIHYFDPKSFFKEVDRILVENGVVMYYSVHFPTVLIPGDETKSKEVNDIFWDYLDNRLKPYWPYNNFSNIQIGSRNRRDYYVHGIECPFSETEVDESVSYDREMTVSELATELDTYGGAVRHRQQEGDEAANAMKAEFITRTMAVLGADQSADNMKLVTRNSFFVVMKRKT